MHSDGTSCFLFLWVITIYSSGTHTSLGARSLICQMLGFDSISTDVLFFSVKACMRSEEVQISERSPPRHIREPLHQCRRLLFWKPQNTALSSNSIPTRTLTSHTLLLWTFQLLRCNERRQYAHFPAAHVGDRQPEATSVLYLWIKTEQLSNTC